MKHGSRAKGTSAGAHAKYILRVGPYSKEADELKYSESGNLPEWADKGELQFWNSADLYEAQNARLYTEFEIAMPRELDLKQQISLIRDFVESEIGNRHPYTLALHESDSRDGRKNPHVHLMFSTRTHDDYRRSEQIFFKRANKKEPWEGGAVKDRSWMPKERLIELRKTWEQVANSALSKAGVDASVDSRSLNEQGIDREPQPKLTPFEYRLWQQQGIASSRTEQVLLLDAVAQLQQKQEGIQNVLCMLDKISSLQAYMTNVEAFLQSQQAKIEELSTRRNNADAVVDSLTQKLGNMPKTLQEAQVTAREHVYGRAYAQHTLELKNASESFGEAQKALLSNIDSPLEAIWRFQELVGDARHFLDKRQDLQIAVSASRQFFGDMRSEEAKHECKILADRLFEEQVEVVVERDTALQQALRLRSLLEKYHEIAGDVSQIVNEVAEDIGVKQQKLPPVVQQYLSIDFAEVGQTVRSPQQVISEKLEQAYRREQSQRLGED